MSIRTGIDDLPGSVNKFTMEQLARTFLALNRNTQITHQQIKESHLPTDCARILTWNFWNEYGNVQGVSDVKRSVIKMILYSRTNKVSKGAQETKQSAEQAKRVALIERIAQDIADLEKTRNNDNSDSIDQQIDIKHRMVAKLTIDAPTDSELDPKQVGTVGKRVFEILKAGDDSKDGFLLLREFEFAVTGRRSGRRDQHQFKAGGRTLVYKSDDSWRTKGQDRQTEQREQNNQSSGSKSQNWRRPKNQDNEAGGGSSGAYVPPHARKDSNDMYGHGQQNGWVDGPITYGHSEQSNDQQNRPAQRNEPAQRDGRYQSERYGQHKPSAYVPPSADKPASKSAYVPPHLREGVDSQQSSRNTRYVPPHRRDNGQGAERDNGRDSRYNRDNRYNRNDRDGRHGQRGQRGYNSRDNRDNQHNTKQDGFVSLDDVVKNKDDDFDCDDTEQFPDLASAYRTETVEEKPSVRKVNMVVEKPTIVQKVSGDIDADWDDSDCSENSDTEGVEEMNRLDQQETIVTEGATDSTTQAKLSNPWGTSFAEIVKRQSQPEPEQDQPESDSDDDWGDQVQLHSGMMVLGTTTKISTPGATFKSRWADSDSEDDAEADVRSMSAHPVHVTNTIPKTSNAIRQIPKERNNDDYDTFFNGNDDVDDEYDDYEEVEGYHDEYGDYVDYEY